MYREFSLKLNDPLPSAKPTQALDAYVSSVWWGLTRSLASYPLSDEPHVQVVGLRWFALGRGSFSFKENSRYVSIFRCYIHILCFDEYVDGSRLERLRAEARAREEEEDDDDVDLDPEADQSIVLPGVYLPLELLSWIPLRERLNLAEAVEQFDRLVFEPDGLARELDFSKEGRLIRPTHIGGYFDDKRICENLRKVNIQNVTCMDVQMLNETLGRATNLVDVNIHGIRFGNIGEVASFLEPLKNIERLSLDWPACSNRDDFAIYEEFLQQRFSRLTHFSTRIQYPVRDLFSVLQCCTELEELRIAVIGSDNGTESDNWASELQRLTNLKIVKISGMQPGRLREYVISVLSDLDRWTEFQPFCTSLATVNYFEKDVEICEQLRNSDWFRNSQSHGDSEPGLTVEYMPLFTEIIRQTGRDAPSTFCDLEALTTTFGCDHMKYPCTIKIDDAKKLLKNPGHEISFLDIRHDIEPNCGVHSFLLAFQNLTELVLTGIKKQDASTLEAGARDRPNLNSAFGMLVQNTPRVKELTIHPKYSFSGDEFDFQSLRSISNWRNLRALRLAYVSVDGGRFLIDIGERCKNLEILVLIHLHARGTGTSPYTSDLPEMLKHCLNLRDFAITEYKIGNLPQVVASLSNNPYLRSFRVVITDAKRRSFPTEELISSTEGLVRRCENLRTFVFKINRLSKNDLRQLESAFERITSEFNRPEFHFGLGTDCEDTRIDTVHEDASTSFLSSTFDWTL